ncbi:MAG: hypothetical protein IT326_00740, partial [Anaerolineae bacterium]|nr:hypothetical protein [Anaerolineae bacterium]
MSIQSGAVPKVIRLYLELSQYPTLAPRIRQRMREELFTRGIIRPDEFEQEVEQKAIQSQLREGLTDPVSQESPDTWDLRLRSIRDNLTDFYFGYNLPHDLLDEIVRETIAHPASEQAFRLSFNPELAPWDVLFEQGELYENALPEERADVEHHLREIIVVLIKAMISDQLAFVRVAREYFTMKDLRDIFTHRISRGKIGGKAAGMLLAYKVLQREGRARGIDVDSLIRIPESWYLASDAFYAFRSRNNLISYMNQKYKRPEQMIADYPEAHEAYINGRFPEHIAERLQELIFVVGKHPLIVRSSSLLEDNFETSFAGKYDSFFLPNQGSPAENLKALMDAIARIYASVIRPDVLIYRDQMGLTDYDERMAILIQKVEGERYGRYFFPSFAGVGFSENPYRWNKRIRREDGMLRMVVGLGTRAVDRVAEDYPRMVALSHPELRPEPTPEMVRRYSQRFIDVIDMEANTFRTLPLHEVLSTDYPGLGAIMSLDRDGYIQPMARRSLSMRLDQMVVTFDKLLQQGQLASLMRDALDVLEQAYHRPVDVEFAG